MSPAISMRVLSIGLLLQLVDAPVGPGSLYFSAPLSLRYRPSSSRFYLMVAKGLLYFLGPYLRQEGGEKKEKVKGQTVFVQQVFSFLFTKGCRIRGFL